MKNLLPLSIASIPAILSLAAPAIAAPAGWADFKDDRGNVYVGASAPNAEIKLELGGMNIKKTVRMNQCGFGKIANTASSPVPATITMQGANISVASLEQKILPKCVLIGGSYQPEEARTASFKTVDGSLVIVSTPNMVIDYTASGFVLKTLTANQCGWGKISNSTTNPIPMTATIRATAGATGFATAVDYGTISQEIAWKCDGSTPFKPTISSPVQ